MKKLLAVMVVLAFACGSMLMMSSCAKKQVGLEAPAPVAKPAPVPAPAAPPSTAAVDMAQDVRWFEGESVYFDFDKYDIRPEAKVVLEKRAAWLRANPSYKVRIEGNTDERGTNEYNMALGDRRAKAAQKYFNALGISMDRMSTISFGEEKPVCKEQNEKCWQKNRRDDFKLSK